MGAKVVRSLVAVEKHAAKVARCAHSLRLIQVDLALEEGDSDLENIAHAITRVLVKRGYVESVESVIPEVHHVPTVTTAAAGSESL